LKSQEPNDNSQAVITIIGDDPAQTNNTLDFINTNPYTGANTPVSKSSKIQQNQDIEPTLVNGFHMRFEVSYSQPMEQEETSSLSDEKGDGNKIKKRGITFTERSLNARKRLKKWLPAHKKRYRPYLCGRF